MSLTGEVRRTTLKTELDRNQWAGVTEKGYQVQLLGEAGEYLTREIYFGRAFEGPPLFAWDASIVAEWTTMPWITVGVANWIQDERLAYIGARIWVKIPCPEVSCDN